MKVSGRRLNYTSTRTGSSYMRVKKSLKKLVTRKARRALNRKVSHD